MASGVVNPHLLQRKQQSIIAAQKSSLCSYFLWQQAMIPQVMMTATKKQKKHKEPMIIAVGEGLLSVSVPSITSPSNFPDPDPSSNSLYNPPSSPLASSVNDTTLSNCRAMRKVQIVKSAQYNQANCGRVNTRSLGLLLEN